MAGLFTKLNLKDQSPVFALNAPASFEGALAALEGHALKRAVKTKDAVSFAIAFAITQAELDAVSATLVRAAVGDAVVWIAYPKQSSKRYRCEFNRDSGWSVLAAGGFETVRMVAIDEDWSALRFRRAEYVGAMTRSPARALTARGKKRTGQ